MKGTRCTILFLMFFGLLNAQTPDTCKVFLSLSDVPLQQIFEKLSEKYNLAFSYQSNLPDLQTKVSIAANNESLREVLQALLVNTRLTFKFFVKQVVIYPRAEMVAQKLLIEGRLYKKNTHEPISFAGMELKIAHKGTISDLQGHFSIEVEAPSTDTLMISSLNFYSLKVPVKHLTLPGLHTLYMTERTYDLSPIEIRGEKQKFERMGNHKWRPSGSFYLDTHGQQTALYIPNEENDGGNLIAISVFLSKNGNTDAPFRIHIYAPDSVTGKPGEELLPEIVIIKPSGGKGWYKVNLSRYRISLQNKGIYVAIEGIFPGDYDFFYNDASQTSAQEGDESLNDFESETISYGQQVGYSGGSNNNTWHYSIDHTWFQLKKKHFNAMISAEFKITKTKGGKGFLGLFGRRKH
jgi:hypothetical protein